MRRQPSFCSAVASAVASASDFRSSSSSATSLLRSSTIVTISFSSLSSAVASSGLLSSATKERRNQSQLLNLHVFFSKNLTFNGNEVAKSCIYSKASGFQSLILFLAVPREEARLSLKIAPSLWFHLSLRVDRRSGLPQPSKRHRALKDTAETPTLGCRLCSLFCSSHSRGRLGGFLNGVCRFFGREWRHFLRFCARLAGGGSWRCGGSSRSSTRAFGSPELTQLGLIPTRFI